MRLSSSSVSSSEWKGSRSGSRLRKKHKRLDAISEEAYKQSHGEANAGDGGDSELRRSSRVRRAPEILDASPPPPRKRPKVNRNVATVVAAAAGGGRSKESYSQPIDESPETPGEWRSRLRARGRNDRAKKNLSSSGKGKRKLFREIGEIKVEKMIVASESDEKRRRGRGLELDVLKSKRPGMIKISNGSEGAQRVPDGSEDSDDASDGSDDSEKAMNDSEDVEKATNDSEGCEKASSGSEDDEKASSGSEEDVKASSGSEEDVKASSGSEDSEKASSGSEDKEKALSGSEEDGDKEAEFLGIEDNNEISESDAMGNGVEEAPETLDGGVGDENEKEIVDGKAREVDEKGKREISAGLQLDEGCTGVDNGNVEPMELNDKPLEESECAKGRHKEDTLEPVEILTSQAEDSAKADEKARSVRLDGEPIEDENTVKTNRSTRDRLGKSRIKEGRRCGLCGGGTDGKPPKKLVHNAGDSENETYSTSSASEEPNYDIWDGFGDEPGWLGRLLGPINDRYGIAGIWVHQHCAVWSPEVYFAGLGCLKNVRAALCRGKALKCTRCGRPGATIGCRVDRCPRTYHLPCARAIGCIFDHRKFLIACTDHRHLFQPHGNRHLFQIKKIKTKKMKLELRKSSNDACRKDIEAEEKWLENCGEDEEFLKRESKRLNRDLLRIAPVYIGGTNSESGKLFQGWESVAGLQNVIQCMKEVVILPLLYPEFFDNLGLTPPRGVLLHGYPGTGKTLVVRALIGSCARGDRRIAYFARKGADCLGKYVGDAERQLRLLFQVAEKCQPSIIFFDEIDGLAPCRTRQQDQTHSSVVSTLLALLDGLKSRGSVVVIGATNRPEAVDPALRRPGRFDREIYFPLPSVQDRAEILSLHTKKWPKPVSGSLLKWVANRTVGFAGADLQALCTQAAMIALKRNFPLHETLSAAEEKAPYKRLSLPAFTVEERDWLEALSRAPPPCSRREAGMAVNDVVSSPLPSHLIPCLLQPLTVLLVSLSIDERLWLPPPVSKAATMIKDIVLSALGRKKMPGHQWWSFVGDFLQDEEVAKEIEKKLLCAGILHGDSISPGADASDGGNDGDDSVKFDNSTLLCGGARPSLLQNLSLTSRESSGYQILISGSPKSGQRHLASCLLHCYVGNVEIHKVDLATASQEGHGDVVQGISYILTKCASVGPCIVFMPRIDLWAVEAHPHDTEECDFSPTTEQPIEKKASCIIESCGDKENDFCLQQAAEMADANDASLSVSHEWSLFVEQLGSLRLSSQLMILATSNVPFPQLPEKIRQFFKGDILNCSRSMSMEHTILRFSIQVDGNFDHDRVVNLSTAELSRELIQQYVQLTHQKKHANINSCKKYTLCDSIEGTTETEAHQSIDHVLANHGEDQTGAPDGTSSKGLPPRNRTMKVKSNLLMALSTFGYQILCYPHFAELCWVTSKLKEGPCVDISGPWKGWPFNSCIVRPNNLSDKVVIASNSSNIKSKENSGLVRGLIAVGLSAYRGIYTSPREVSFEVRKVLELLVGQINVKVQAGKDRCQYVRLLSQVAYLEDMVNSWAHALQSLESDTHMIQENPKQNAVISSQNDNTGVDSQVQNLECEMIVGDQSSLELKPSEDTPQQVTVETSENIGLSERNGNVDDPNIDRRATVTISEDGFQHKHDILDNSRIMDQVVGETLHELKKSTTFPQPDSHIVNCAMSHEDPELLNQSNGSAFTESANDGKPEHEEPSVDPNTLSGKETNPCADSELVCLYHCCSECVHTVHSLMHKILVRELELTDNCRTVEDIHDVVSSLSVDLLSTIRKVHVTENPSTRSVNSDMVVHLGLRDCQCKDFGGGHVECSCHSTGGSASTQTGLGSKFVFRDGVLGPLDVDKGVSFHCKFETLCLCSMIESIVMTKQSCD